MTTWDVIVVGGGLAGLTAGATAAQAGASTLVLDAAKPGGRARVAERDGFTFNMGAHALYMGGDAIGVLRRLGIEPQGAPPDLRKYRILMDGDLHLMPSGATSLLRTTALTARSKAALAKLLGLLPRMRASDHAGKTVNELIGEFGLRDDAAAVLRALIRIGTYSDRFDEMSADAAILQLQRAAKAGVIYLHGGWAQLIDALGAQTNVRASTSVRSVEPEGTGVRVVTDDEVLTARAVVVAAGTPTAARAVLKDAPSWGDLGEPLTAACLDVAVRGVADPGYVLGIDEPVYGTTQSPPARQAPPGDSVVAVIRYGARSAPEDRPLLDGWLDLVGVTPDAILNDRFLARMVVTGSCPRPDLGGLRGRPAIDATGAMNVFLAGDWVGLDGMLADASFASGHAAGLLAARHASDRSASMVA